MVRQVTCKCGHKQTIQTYGYTVGAEEAAYWMDQICQKCARQDTDQLAIKWGTPIYPDEGATRAHAEALREAVMVQRKQNKRKRTSDAKTEILARVVRQIQTDDREDYWRNQQWHTAEETVRAYIRATTWVYCAEQDRAR